MSLNISSSTSSTGLIENPKALENDLRQVVRKHIYRKMKKYPLIVPHVFVM